MSTGVSTDHFFLAAAFLAGARLAAAFFAGAFLAGAFLAAAFLAGAFLAAAFLAGAFFAAAFLAGAFLAAAFLAGAFFAAAFFVAATGVSFFLVSVDYLLLRAALSVLLAVNFIRVAALMSTGAPVWGLRPVRAWDFEVLNVTHTNRACFARQLQASMLLHLQSPQKRKEDDPNG